MGLALCGQSFHMCYIPIQLKRDPKKKEEKKASGCTGLYNKLQLKSFAAALKYFFYIKFEKIKAKELVSLCACPLHLTSLESKAIRVARWWAGLTVNSCIDRRSLQQK